MREGKKHHVNVLINVNVNVPGTKKPTFSRTFALVLCRKGHKVSTWAVRRTAVAVSPSSVYSLTIEPKTISSSSSWRGAGELSGATITSFPWADGVVLAGAS